MWREFFSMSRSDMRGLALFCLLLFLYVVGVRVYRDYYTEDVPEETIADSVDTGTYRQYARNSNVRYPDRNYHGKVSLFPFDPNTADSITLLRLGMKWYQVRNLLKYRRAGGHFRTPDALARLYGLTEEEFLRLRPYVRIADSEQSYGERSYTASKDYRYRDSAYSASIKYERIEKYPTGTVLDLNGVDTTELKKIPGIGSGRARMIVRYREELGGFHSPEQLKDLHDFLPEEVETWFKVSPRESLRKVAVNTLTFEELRKHPYLHKYSVAKAIVQYRRMYGDIADMKQLAFICNLSEEERNRLEPYIVF